MSSRKTERISFFKSLRLRLTLWYLGVLALTLMIFSGLLYLFLSAQLYKHHDESLLSAADAIGGILQRDYPAKDVAELAQREDIFRSNSLMIADEDGKLIYLSPKTQDERIEFRPHGQARDGRIATPSNRPFAYSYYTIEVPMSHGTGVHASSMRVIVARLAAVDGRLVVVQVASALGDVRSTLRDLRWALALLVPGVILLASFSGLFMAQRALRPVDRITSVARQITATNLAQRLDMPETQDELSRLAATLNEMIARLERAFKQLKQFTADASHELQTPITVIKGSIEVALKAPRAPEEYAEILSGCLDEVNRLERIVRDLLTLATADSGTELFELEPLRLDEVLLEMADFLKVLSENKGLHTELRGVDNEVLVAGDKNRLRQMILNLVDNAVKYTPTGGTITLGLEKNHQYARLSVSDTGDGIPEKDLPFIFTRFYRVDKARQRASGGFGLGLAIVKQIAEAHHGNVTVESQVGKGSTFTLQLPLETCSIKSGDTVESPLDPVGSGS